MLISNHHQKIQNLSFFELHQNLSWIGRNAVIRKRNKTLEEVVDQLARVIIKQQNRAKSLVLNESLSKHRPRDN